MIGSEARLQRRRAARAIAVEVALAGAASMTIVNRDPRRGLELVALWDVISPNPAHKGSGANC
jgi:shikimate 5-dehydrogenase